ncbi:hypothetical protein ERJ75_001649200 [Trypanosoma vivax]|nr:hypothetical protein TRVL_04128 [Trypanosoma vivax]KAH8605162.1 hypothetical protein ERJ75_001649200 [Trypanosoma vivax]
MPRSELKKRRAGVLCHKEEHSASSGAAVGVYSQAAHRVAMPAYETSLEDAPGCGESVFLVCSSACAWRASGEHFDRRANAGNTRYFLIDANVALLAAVFVPKPPPEPMG